MKLQSILITGIVGLVAFASCRKPESEIPGCMDTASINYDPRATVDDGSCEYYDLNYALWNEGLPGVWGSNESTEDMHFNSCKGEVDTVVFQNSTDSTLVLYMMRDTLTGDAAFALSTINPVDAVEFKNGYMSFEALLPSASTMTTFQVAMSGTVNYNLGDCGSRFFSQAINVSTDVLNDSSFVTVQLPLVDFFKKDFVDIQDIMSIQCNHADASSGDTLLMVRNLRWLSN